MGNEPPVLIGFMGDRVPDDDQTHAEALSKFGGMPVRPSPLASLLWHTAPVKALRQRQSTKCGDVI